MINVTGVGYFFGVHLIDLVGKEKLSLRELPYGYESVVCSGHRSMICSEMIIAVLLL